jgi:hypothetical protein
MSILAVLGRCSPNPDIEKEALIAGFKSQQYLCSTFSSRWFGSAGTSATSTKQCFTTPQKHSETVFGVFVFDNEILHGFAGQ